MHSTLVALLLFLSCTVGTLRATSSPLKTFANYTYSTELQLGLADLWWSIDDVRKEITFEFHLKTTGWIALGISPGIRLPFRLVRTISMLTFDVVHS